MLKKLFLQSLIVILANTQIAFAKQTKPNPRFIEIRGSSPIDYHKYNQYKPQIIQGFVKDVYLVEYLYFDRPLRVVGLEIETLRDEIYQVHLGPPSLLIEENIILQKGDIIRLKGTRMNIDQQQVIVASKIWAKGKTLKLRDSHGIPEWKPTHQRGRSPVYLFNPVAN